jgi:hypothetical protein
MLRRAFGFGGAIGTGEITGIDPKPFGIKLSAVSSVHPNSRFSHGCQSPCAHIFRAAVRRSPILMMSRAVRCRSSRIASACRASASIPAALMALSAALSNISVKAVTATSLVGRGWENRSGLRYFSALVRSGAPGRLWLYSTRKVGRQAAHERRGAADSGECRQRCECQQLKPRVLIQIKVSGFSFSLLAPEAGWARPQVGGSNDHYHPKNFNGSDSIARRRKFARVGPKWDSSGRSLACGRRRCR